MKNTLIILILVFGSTAYGQTDSIEKAIIFKKLKDKEIRQDDFAKTLTGWTQTLKETGEYPDLPLDKSGLVHYLYLYELTGFNKEKLFKRSLEWLSINYGLFPSYIYSDLEDGKIIYRNNINLITGNACTYSSIISIKDEKILIEFLNIGYQTYSEGHYSNNSWIPEKTIDFGINEVYPVILKKPSGWNASLNLLKVTNGFFNTEKEILYNYITGYDFSYNF